MLKQSKNLSEVELIVSDEIDSDVNDTFGPFCEPVTTTEHFKIPVSLSHALLYPNYKKE